MKKLVQKGIFKESVFEIREKGLFFFMKTFSNRFEEVIQYEDISNRVTRSHKKESVFLVIGTSLTIIGVLSLLRGSLEAFLVLLVLGLGSFLALRLTMKDIILLYVRENQVLTIRANQPSAEEVEQFLEDLTNCKKDYLIKKYASVDRDLPVEGQLNNLIWLKNSDYISDEEFNSLKIKILGKDSGTKIGF